MTYFKIVGQISTKLISKDLNALKIKHPNSKSYCENFPRTLLWSGWLFKKHLIKDAIKIESFKSTKLMGKLWHLLRCGKIYIMKLARLFL
jgi:hypothetical protein